MRQNVRETSEAFRLELWRRASTYGDLESWVAFQQGMEEPVLAWLHVHPSREAARRVQSESQFVIQAFERFWHIVIQREVQCETLAEALVCLRASLNGAILEELRITRREGSASSLPDREEPSESGVLWGNLQAALSNEREQRLAYLLYHCGMKPAEIVQDYPQEWSDFHEVLRLRRDILARLMQSPVLVSPEEIGEIQPSPAPTNARWDGVSKLSRLAQSEQVQ